ncbi:MAG: dihydrodipicolinate synthase family protein [Planctomycetes bacterium]|nr:dihydrodipicolinate synthase family protein [Planctomycetota bacterium]
MSSTKLRERLKNVHAYAVTPFQRKNLMELDLDGLAGNLRFLIGKGVQVINVGGGTGEIEALTDGELEALARVALDVAGDHALVLPTLPGNLRAAMELAPRYQQMGAKVLLAMPPFIRHQVPPKLDGVWNFYRMVSQATSLPLMPYNTQGWQPDFFARLAEIDRIIGIKDPCVHPHNLFKAMRRLGKRFVWIGNKRHDAGVLQYRYQAGIQGYTAGLVNFVPGYELEMHRAAQREDWDRMAMLQEKVAGLERLREVHGDAALLKAGLDLIGLAGGPVRPPRVDVSEAGRAELARELNGLGTPVCKKRRQRPGFR